MKRGEERRTEREGKTEGEREREIEKKRAREKPREDERKREREREGQLALRTGYNCLTLKKMGCVRGGGGWTDVRESRTGRGGLEDVAEEVVVLREAGGRRAAGQRVVGLRTTSMERYNRVARMCRSKG